MSRVSMTLPQYRRGECRIDGFAVHLTRQEAELLALLLVSPPEVPVAADLMLEVLWPDPDEQPLETRKIGHVHLSRLRRKGVTITTRWGFGWHIPASGRALCQRDAIARRLAA